MQCPHCAHELPSPAPRFCPQCGQALEAPASAPPATPSSPISAAAENLAAKLPGRSLTVGGAALIGLAILLSLVPGFYGPGFLWSLIALALGAIAVQQELRLPQVTLPSPVDKPVIGPAFALISAVLAWSMLSFKLLPLIWLAGTLLVCYDQYRKETASPEGLATQFDPRLWFWGYRRLMLVGTVICFIALLFTFNEGMRGGFAGGYDYRYAGGGRYSYQWNFIKYYNPGIPASSGRAQAGATLAMLAMVGMVLWAGYRGNGTVPTWWRWVPAVGCAFLFLWWWSAASGGFGVWLFLVGMLMIDVAGHFLFRDVHEGKWDLSQYLERIPFLKMR